MREGFDKIKERVAVFADHLEFQRENIYKALSGYQPNEVTQDEIWRAQDALLNIEQNSAYYNNSIGKTSIFLPTNLPLYSTVIFGVLPSLISDEVYLRPNQIMQDANLFEKLLPVLELDKYFVNIHIEELSRKDFNQKHTSTSDCVVFTGSPVNSRKILEQMQDGALLISNGAGHNPFVVSSDADLEKAINDAVFVKSFNSGQDCAGPDAILVHQDIAQKFIAKFTESFGSLKTGSYEDYDVKIGPIFRWEELQKFARAFYEDKELIICGGNINYKDSLVEPTVMVSDIKNNRNYKEMFGPVAYIHTYSKDEDLSIYFEDENGKYASNKMYISLYGSSEYIEARNDANLDSHNGVGIVIKEQTIHDVERGNLPYGGYSIGASCVMKKQDGKILVEAKPTNIPQEIDKYLIRGEEIKPAQEEKNNSSKVKKPPRSFIDHIAEDFKYIVQEVFGDNLAFAFIFGSVAKHNIRNEFTRKSDLDTFICLKEAPDDVDKSQYLGKLIQLQRSKGLAPDMKYPYEIMTVRDLQDVLDNLPTIKLDPTVTNSEDNFTSVIWTQILNDKKLGFTGDGRLMSSLIKQSQGQLERIRDDFLDQIDGLEDKEELKVSLNEDIANYRKAEPLKTLRELVQFEETGIEYDIRTR